MTGAKADRPSSETDSTEAQLAAARFRRLSGEIRGCAILGSSGVLAATGDDDEWRTAGEELLAGADAAAGARACQAHVATEEGEAYAVRLGELAMVAVTDRFALSSLVLADMRAALRALAPQADRAGVPA